MTLVSDCVRRDEIIPGCFLGSPLPCERELIVPSYKRYSSEEQHRSKTIRSIWTAKCPYTVNLPRRIRAIEITG